MKDRATLDQERQARTAAIKRVMKTADGQKLLEELEITFDGSLMGLDGKGGVDPHRTFINVGAREVVVHLKAIRDREA